MSDVVFEEINIPEVLYFARILPPFGYYEIHELKINHRYENPKDHNQDYIAGSDKDTKQRFTFGKKSAEEKLFHDRDKALKYLQQEEKENKDVKVYGSDPMDWK